MPQPHIASRIRRECLDFLYSVAARIPRSLAIALSWRKNESPVSNSIPLSVCREHRFGLFLNWCGRNDEADKGFVR